MIMIKILCLGVLLVACSSFIEHTSTQGTALLYRYFLHSKAQFFICIGASDPVRSNPMAMFPDWHGVYVEKSQYLARNALISNRGHRVYNFAISPTTGAELEVPNGDPVRQSSGKSSFVPMITLADVCKNYYYSRPKVLLLNDESSALLALQTADWGSPICIPEYIYLERGDLNLVSAITSLLTPKGYSKQPTLTQSQIWIRTAKSIEEPPFAYDQSQIVSYHIVLAHFWQLAGRENTFYEHTPVLLSDSPLHIHYAREQLVNLKQILKYSNSISQKQNRGILILHFDPGFHVLHVGGSYVVSKHRKSKLEYLEVEVFLQSLKIMVFVFGVVGPIHILESDSLDLFARPPSREEQVEEVLELGESFDDMREEAPTEQEPDYLLLGMFTVSWILLTWVASKTKMKRRRKIPIDHPSQAS